MTNNPFLRIWWLTQSDGSPEPVPNAEIVSAYMEALDDSGERAGSSAYAVVKGGSTTEAIHQRLHERRTKAVVGADIYTAKPNCIVVTEMGSLDEATALESELSNRVGKLERAFGTAAPQTIAHGIYREVSTVIGQEADLVPASGFGPVVQVGTFNMPSGEDELAVQEWYRTRRLPSFAAIKGGIRARRLIGVCGAPAQLGILYEFTSLQERIEHFEPLEAVDHDEHRPSAAARTQHPPFSPGVGILLSTNRGSR
jgi:hypothetical protein